MHQTNVTTSRERRGQEPPIVAELQAIFVTLPDTDLLALLRGPRRRGPRGYNAAILWRCYVTYYALGLESVSALIRFLHNNPYVAAACGIKSPDDIPSQPTFSRFGTRLAKRWPQVAVRNIQRTLTRRFYEFLPDFGKSVAIDSTHMKGWTNANKRGRRGEGRVRRQRARVGKPSDPDAGWIIKTNSQGRQQSWFGFKAHILADTKYEIPLVVDVTPGNVHDVRKASALLQQVRFSYKVDPKYVIADAGYSSESLRRLIRQQYAAVPVIDPNRAHKRAIAQQEKIADWKQLMKRRTSVERVNSRLKAFCRLDSVRVRGRLKVRVHAFMSVIVLQARALAYPAQMRHCVHAA